MKGAPYKRVSRETLCPPTMWGHSKELPLKPGRGRSPESDHSGTLILDFSVSRTVRNQCVLFKRPSLCILLWQPKLANLATSAQLVKNPPAMLETWVRSLGWEDSPGEGNGYPLQYSGLENSMDMWHGVAKSQTRLSDFHYYYTSSSKLSWLLTFILPSQFYQFVFLSELLGGLILAVTFSDTEVIV